MKVYRKRIEVSFMNSKQIEGIKEACRQVNSLRYTFTYKVSKFEITELDDGDLRVDFGISRVERFKEKNVKTNQTGTIYVNQKGKLYWITFMGKKKPLTLIGYTVSLFEPASE